MNSAGRFSVGVEHQPGGRVAVVALAGRLEPLAVEELEGRLAAQERDGTRRVVFDLSALEHTGSLGLRALVGFANKVRGTGRVVACGPTPAVREIFTLTRVSQLIPLYATRADALDAVRL